MKSRILRALCCGVLLASACTDEPEEPVGDPSIGAPAQVTRGDDAAVTSERAPEGRVAEAVAPETTATKAPWVAWSGTPAQTEPPSPTEGADAPAAPEGAPRRGAGWVPWGAPAGARQVTPPTTDLVTLHDPIEDAYTIGMPRGWQNRTHSVRVFDVHGAVVTSISPDGSVLIFGGDPGLPRYFDPASATPVHHDMARIHPRVELRSFVPADTYFPDYVRTKFGALPDFALLAVEENPAVMAWLREGFAARGFAARPTVANVSFRYTDAGRAMRALVIGSTIDHGPFWLANVWGVATEGDPRDYEPMVNAMARSYETNPAWQRQQQAKHQERMAQIESWSRQSAAQHQQNMAAMQQNARLHQERMRALQAQSDASMQSYRDRMAADDAQHGRFLNYINDERTVVDSSGRTFQVDDHYQRYYVNRHDGTYVGGDVTMDPDALRALGLDPSDYEEVKIVR